MASALVSVWFSDVAIYPVTKLGRAPLWVVVLAVVSGRDILAFLLEMDNIELCGSFDGSSQRFLIFYRRAHETMELTKRLYVF